MSGIVEIAAGITTPATAVLALAGTIVVLAIAAIVSQPERQKYPPGPSRLDAVYGFVFNSQNIMEHKKRWRQRFGQIYSLFIGKRRGVFLTDYDLIHDAFVRHADVCSSRPEGHGSMLTDADTGLTGSPHYKEQRRFALTVLREQGMGKIDMERKILEEIRPYLQEIESSNEKPLDMDGYNHRAVSNIICNLVLGSRFEYSDPVFVSLLSRFLNHLKHFRKMTAINVLPFLKLLPGDIFGYHRYVRDIERNKEFFREAIAKHRETLDPQHPRDFIDAYLLEIKAHESNDTSNPSTFDEVNCISTVIQLFVAGTDTTANTLLWAWLFMMLHKDVQLKVQSEIDTCIGSRHPSLRDKPQMPYTEAVLTEVMRLANTAPSTLLHKADEPIEIGGYVLPSGTIVAGSICDVHLDERTYPEPTIFKPERFIGADGAFEKPKKIIPFGLGRRVCVGESLARAELFLFFTCVLQKFNITAPAGSAYKAEGICELVHKPLPYKVIFTRRQLTDLSLQS